MIQEKKNFPSIGGETKNEQKETDPRIEQMQAEIDALKKIIADQLDMQRKLALMIKRMNPVVNSNSHMPKEEQDLQLGLNMAAKNIIDETNELREKINLMIKE